MDTVKIIVAALAARAEAGLNPTAKKEITDAYNGIKKLIQHRYSKIDLKLLEELPESKSQQEYIAKELVAVSAFEDKELMSLIKTLIDIMEKYNLPASTVTGIDLENVKASFLKVSEVTSKGTGIKVKNSEFPNGIDFGIVRSGDTEKSPKG